MHKRGDPNESATHEFWSHDGKTIWYDLQKAKGQTYTLAGIDVETGKEIAYSLTKAEASLHYNVSSDGSVFCGDGNEIAHGDVGSHGHTTLDRKWIELLQPSSDGALHSSRLARLSNHDYSKTEPNARFSPDNKLVIFTSNMFGPTYVFAVEVDKAAVN
jgi:oligogalacturonide lyase